MSRRKSNTPLAWQKSREPSFTKSNPNSRPMSQEGQKHNTGGSRRNSVLSLLPKTPPGSRRYSITPDRESNTVNEQEDRTGDEEKGADVASKATFKVSRFLDYYNEALRRRFERELMKPTTVPKADEVSASEPVTSEYEDTFGEEPVGKAAAYWKKVLAKTTAVTKVAEPVRTRKISFPSHALSQIQKRKAVKNVQKLLRRMEVRRKFRKKTRIIIFCIRCVKNHSFKFRERSELTPYMNTLNYIDYRNDQVKDLMFDRSQFSANRQMRISEETKRILSKRKSDRTDNEVYSAQIALRNIRSFAELPVRMQQMIARAGQYESYESQRVITRENHPPSAFYFILSGAAVAMKMDPERPDIAIPIKEYVKGDNFEESPLLNDTAREVTILTKEQCEFLSISSSDYREIFMAGGVKNLNDPDMEMFLKSLNFLNGWPIQLLQENPKECRFHYFKRGVVLADDSRKSPWLIIVKSGSISVMKKLRKVGPFEWRKNNGLKPLTEKESRERMHERQQWRRYVLPELRITLRKQNDFEEIEERVDGKPKPFQHPDIKVHLEDSESSDKKGKKYYYPNLWAYSATDDADKGTTFSNINKQYLYTISSSSHTAKDGRGQHRKSGTTIVKPPATAPLPERPRGLSESRNIPSPTHSEVSQISLRSLLTSSVDSEDSVRTPSSVFDERIKTIAAGVRSGGESLSEIDLNPEFVNIQTLIKGDVWGIADLMLEGQPSFIVISNGADCVLISKNFYKLHCSEKLQRQLKHELCPYPSDNELQESLQVSVDWDEHKRCELTSTIDRVRNQKCLRDIPINCKVVETVK